MEPSSLGFKPLYKQVYDYLTRQIIDGKWRATDKLPSEQELAALLNVSQGTVRKALDVMVSEDLIERQQGRGTIVAEQTQARATFRFYRLARPNSGERVSPQCADTLIKRRESTARECKDLQLGSSAEVYEINRCRLSEGRPIATERIIVPARLFDNLDRFMPLPNALYSLYQQEFGINIMSADEELSVVTASKRESNKLQVDVSHPLLQIDRTAIAMDGKRVELRRSRCNMDGLVYSVVLR